MPNAIPATPADGNVKVVIVTAVAGDAPTLSELNAAVDISCYLTPDGFAYSVEQASITDERLCSTETFNLPGRKTTSLALTGIDNTNSDLEDEFNEMSDVLTEGAQRFAVYRSGVPFGVPFAAGQKVRVIPFLTGVKTEIAPEANSVLRSTWATFPNGPLRAPPTILSQ